MNSEFPELQAMKKKILILEDEPDLARLLFRLFESEGYQTLVFADGVTGIQKIRSERPDLLILDLMIPGTDGFEICKKIRRDPAVGLLPILILTAKAEESNKIIGLELGADDFMTKPFSQRELVSRVKALLRRAVSRVSSGEVMAYQEVTLDTGRHEVKAGSRGVILTAKEFKLLECLISKKGRVLTREMLLNTIWGYDYFGTTRTVDVHISRLRDKLPEVASQIISVNQLGYKLKDDSK